MDTKPHKRGIRHINGNASEDSLLNSESNENDPIAFTHHRLNIIDNDEELKIMNHHQIKKLQDHQNFFSNQYPL